MIRMDRSMILSILISIGFTKLLAPKMNKILNILLPITFPTAISFSPFSNATNDVHSSGREVPIATIDKPIKRSLKPKLRAISVALFTVRFPPNITQVRPTKIKITSFILKGCCSTFFFEESTPFIKLIK